MAGATTKYLSDYRPPPFWVDRVELEIQIHEGYADVRSTLLFRRNPEEYSAAFRLDGRGFALQGLKLDGEPVPTSQLELDELGLTLLGAPDAGALEITTRLHPDQNTSLEGLYRSGESLCTQCEAHGFSRITYFPDRPDVLARYRVRLEADQARYPSLLANGNRIGNGTAASGRHWALWEDPFPKPCYLFAIVAGRFDLLEKLHRTPSGREVKLQLYLEPGMAGRGAFALDALERAARWDEQTYGLECDLDQYMVVAVRDFNMGAMENKGLNIFNSRFVLADAETATDDDFAHVEAVIGHEYFHNWTGNRVTCRDWFQLSLKEGLTVFREQQFCADQGSAGLRRIESVRNLRAHQFPEDAGPLAHPVQPQSYIEVNNFYTATVYEKGAEVVRMLHTLLGREAFTRGVQHYLKINDGRAATIDDWLRAHEEASGRDLAQFRRWYTQAGTPLLGVCGEYDSAARRLKLVLTQPGPEALLIPIRVALFRADGHLIREALLELAATRGEFLFEDIDAAPVVSLPRGFSAPVRVDFPQTPETLRLLSIIEPDAFTRWEALQQLAADEIRRRYQHLPATDHWVEACGSILRNAEQDPALTAELLRLPEPADLMIHLAPVNPERLHEICAALRLALARRWQDRWQQLANRLTPSGAWQHSAEEVGRRRLHGMALYYTTLASPAQASEAIAGRYAAADNMTDRLAALQALNEHDGPVRDRCFTLFFDRHRHDALTLDKWFALQAASPAGDVIARIESLIAHPDFDWRNPNRVRAVLASFAQLNPRGFHQGDGAAYARYAGWLVQLDRLNPQTAARLAQPLTRWRQFDNPWSERMRESLQWLAGQSPSVDLAEILNRGLAD